MDSDGLKETPPSPRVRLCGGSRFMDESTLQLKPKSWTATHQNSMCFLLAIPTQLTGQSQYLWVCEGRRSKMWSPGTSGAYSVCGSSLKELLQPFNCQRKSCCKRDMKSSFCVHESHDTQRMVLKSADNPLLCVHNTWNRMFAFTSRVTAFQWGSDLIAARPFQLQAWTFQLRSVK